MKLKNQQISRKCYNRSVCIKRYNVYNNELVNCKVTIFVLVGIEIKFWLIKIINNF